MKQTHLFGAALLALLIYAGSAASAERAEAPSVLPFIQNDYDRALAEARARKVPLFIEVWAPW